MKKVMIAFLILAACCTNRHVSPDIRQVSAGTAKTADDSGTRMMITDLGGDMIPDEVKIASDTGRDMHNILHLVHSIRPYEVYRTATWRDTAAHPGKAAIGWGCPKWDTLQPFNDPGREEAMPSYPQPFGDEGNRLLKEQIQALSLFARIDSLEARIKALEDRPRVEISNSMSHPNTHVYLTDPKGTFSIELKNFDYVFDGWELENDVWSGGKISRGKADSTAYSYPEVRKNIGEVTTEKVP